MNPPPLRILQVNSLFRGGGVDNQTTELAAGLREQGDRVFLAVPAGDLKLQTVHDPAPALLHGNPDADRTGGVVLLDMQPYDGSPVVGERLQRMAK